MRSEPTVTPGRRLLALVICALLLGAASVGVDAVTGHAATGTPSSAVQAPGAAASAGGGGGGAR